MVNYVKTFAEVEQIKESDLSFVCRRENFVSYVNKCFGGMARSKSMLCRR